MLQFEYGNHTTTAAARTAANILQIVFIASNRCPLILTAYSQMTLCNLTDGNNRLLSVGVDGWVKDCCHHTVSVTTFVFLISYYHFFMEVNL